MAVSLQAGIADATDRMESGALFRYHEADTANSPIVRAEKALAALVCHKYGCATNSCGCALFLALKSVGVKHADRVLVNAFTFDAVPGAIDHCGATPVLVNCTEGLTMDLEGLHTALESQKDDPNRARVLLLSHMRGRVCDMDRVVELCDRFGVVLVEDCAHALCCAWRGRPAGSFGVVSATSFQSHKIINTGEGGMTMTSDPVIAAKLVLYTGAYELKYQKHHTDIDESVFRPWLTVIPNYSMRMTALQGALLWPQCNEDVLHTRQAVYADNYRYFDTYLQTKSSDILPVARDRTNVTYVLDSFQFRLPADWTENQVVAFNAMCTDFGCQCLHLSTNARNHHKWDYVPDTHSAHLKATDNHLKNVYDLRLTVNQTRETLRTKADALLQAVTSAREKA